MGATTLFLVLASLGLAWLFQLPPIATSGVTFLPGFILVIYWAAWLFLSWWRRNRELGDLLQKLTEKQNEYQAKYGSSWIAEGVMGFGAGFGEGYSEASADDGDIVGTLVGQGIKLFASAIGNVVISPEQRQLAEHIQFLQHQVNQIQGQHSRFSFWYSAIMIGTFYWWVNVREPPQPISPPPTVEEKKPPTIPFSLEGNWRDESNLDRYKATQQGDRVIFTRQTAAGPRDPYTTGDEVFSLGAPSESEVFGVEMMMRPVLPVGVRLDTTARTACVQSWKDFRGSPLQASLKSQRLKVPFLKTSVPASGLQIKGSKVVGCKPVDASKLEYAEKILVRESQ